MTSEKGINKDVDLLHLYLLTTNSLKPYFKDINNVNCPFLDNDDDASAINCNYVDINSFNYKNKKGSLSLFHLNISSLSKNIDEFETILNMIVLFGVIGITETKIKTTNPGFDTNINGYKCYSTPTEGGKGEIRSKTKKNIIVGCIYRHPSMDLNEFNEEFFNPLMEKIGSEDRKLFLMGDFDIDLLRVDVNTPTTNLFDVITTNLLVPHIIIPTRITSTTRTLIDNIYSNSTNFKEGISGNLTMAISDHLVQFLIIQEEAYKIHLLVIYIKEILIMLTGLSFYLIF